MPVSVPSLGDLLLLRSDLEALEDRVRVLETRQAPTEPPPAEPPVEPPAPPIDPSDWDFEEITFKVNRGDMLALSAYGHGNRYQRSHSHLVLSGVQDVQINRESHDATVPFKGKVSLFLDGQLVSEQEVDVTKYGYLRDVDFSGFADGRYLATITCDTLPNATSIPLPVYVKNTDAPVDNTFMYSWTGTYDLKRKKNGVFHCVKVPTSYNPEIIPMPIREYSKEIITNRRQWWCRQLVPAKHGDLPSSSIDEHGIISMGGRQNYYNDSLPEFPEVAAIDGDRGYGRAGCFTHLEIAPAGGGVYGTRGQSVLRVWGDGRVQTRAGYRNKTRRPYDHKNQPDAYELVGDWSAVDGPHGFSKLWGWTFWGKTIAENPDGKHMVMGRGSDETLPMHAENPKGFVPDAGHDRLCMLEFPMDADTIMGAHDLPPKVTVINDKLENPWDCDEDSDEIFVTERAANRISIINPKTGERTPFIDSPGAPPTIIDARSDKPRSVLNREQARAYPCIAPDGIRVWDRWVYWGSYITAQIKRKNRDTGEVQVVVPYVKTDNNSAYIKFDVAKDDSILPAGSIAVATWTATLAPFGLYGPDGEGLRITPRPGGNVIAGQSDSGYFSYSGYPTAPVIGVGVIYSSDMSGGLAEWSGRKDGDIEIDMDKYNAQEKAFIESGGLEKYGAGGWCEWGKAVAGEEYLRARDLG